VSACPRFHFSLASHTQLQNRAPEILLGAKTYSTAIDMWSVGCIFAELLLKEPLFQAKAEIELISMIFKLLGSPTNDSWPEYSSLPLAKTITLPSPQPHQFRQKFPFLTIAGIDLLSSLLTYDPERRITAEEALQHPYFSCVPAILLVIDRLKDLL
jgi:cell division cycle 2-like protein